MSRLRFHRTGDDERGAVAVMVALMMTVLCLAGAFAIDLGNVSRLHKQAQTAVDDAALSGAALLAQGTTQGTTNLAAVVSAVETYVQENYASVTSSQWSSCDPSTSPYQNFQPGENCISFNNNTAPTAINVALPPQNVNYTLARAGGLTHTNVTASATASASGQTGGPCALCVLGTSGTTLSVSGGSIAVHGPEGIMVNSSSTAAMATKSGTPQVTSDASIDVNGGYSGSGFTPPPVTGVAPVPDPLAFLPDVPTEDPLPANATPTNVTGGGTIGPNYGNIGYYGTLNIGESTLTLEPGIYIITGGISLSGNGSLISNGALLYLTCGDSQGNYVSCGSTKPAPKSEATITMGGNPTVQMSGYASAPYTGMSIFMDRQNTSTLQLQGDATSSYAGTIYAASGGLSFQGNAGGLASLIVVNSVSVANSSTSSLTINYNPVGDPTQNVLIPTPFLCSPTAGNC